VITDEVTAGLRSRLLAGAGWKLLGQVTLQIVRVAVAVALARLLTPREYGLAGMAFAAAALAGPFASLALGSALVQRPRLDERDRSTVFWVNVGAGAALTAIGVVLAAPVASFFGEPAVRDLLVVLSAGYLLTGLAATQAALLTRALRFRALELIGIATTLAGAVAAVALAAAGAGAWALIAQGLVSAVLQLALLWAVSDWRPRARPSRARLRDLGGFGARMLATRVLFTLHRNVDNVLVGRFLGSGPLGAYALAYNLSLIPFGRIVDPARDLLYPALSRLQHEPERVAAAWLRVTRLLIVLLAPALLGLAVVADDFVAVLLGARWDDAAVPLALLAVTGALQSAIALNSVVLPALDRTRELLRFAVITFAVSLAGFAAGLPFGIDGVAAGYLAANLVVVPLYLRLVARLVSVETGRLLRALAGPAAVAAAVLLVAAVVHSTLAAAGTPAGVRLAVTAVIGGAAGFWAVARITPDVAQEVLDILRRRA
jgi:O-antigen/teichoic acid export membrane protein